MGYNFIRTGKQTFICNFDGRLIYIHVYIFIIAYTYRLYIVNWELTTLFTVKPKNRWQ